MCIAGGGSSSSGGPPLGSLPVPFGARARNAGFRSLTESQGGPGFVSISDPDGGILTRAQVEGIIGGQQPAAEAPSGAVKKRPPALPSAASQLPKVQKPPSSNRIASSVEAARLRQLATSALNRGRRGTIFTSASGLFTQAPLAPPTLSGV